MDTDETPQEPNHSSALRMLIIEARYYEDVSDALMEGATTELQRHSVSYDVITVPGALEIPLALAGVVSDGLMSSNDPDGYDGVVALGCVIRGETAHFDVVANNANHHIMSVAVQNNIPLGNAILTVETKEQAMTRATGDQESKGAQAVRACLTLVALREQRLMSSEL